MDLRLVEELALLVPVQTEIREDQLLPQRLILELFLRSVDEFRLTISINSKNLQLLERNPKRILPGNLILIADMNILDGNLDIVQDLGEHASEKSFLLFVFLSVCGLFREILDNGVTIA